MKSQAKNKNLALFDTRLSLDELKDFLFSVPLYNQQGQLQYFILNINDRKVFIHSVIVLDRVLFLEIETLNEEEGITEITLPFKSVTIEQMRNFTETKEWESLDNELSVFAIHTALYKQIGHHYLERSYLISSN